jgi:hypothetical protein
MQCISYRCGRIHRMCCNGRSRCTETSLSPHELAYVRNRAALQHSRRPSAVLPYPPYRAIQMGLRRQEADRTAMFVVHGFIFAMRAPTTSQRRQKTDAHSLTGDDAVSFAMRPAFRLAFRSRCNRAITITTRRMPGHVVVPAISATFAAEVEYACHQKIKSLHSGRSSSMPVTAREPTSRPQAAAFCWLAAQRPQMPTCRPEKTGLDDWNNRQRTIALRPGRATRTTVLC